MLIEKVEINGFGNLINKKFSFKNEKEKIIKELLKSNSIHHITI